MYIRQLLHMVPHQHLNFHLQLPVVLLVSRSLKSSFLQGRQPQHKQECELFKLLLNDLSCIAQLRCMEEIAGKVVDEGTRQAL